MQGPLKAAHPAAQADQDGDGNASRRRGRPRLDADPVKYLVHYTLRGVKELVRRELHDQPRLLERVLTGIDRFNEDLVAEFQAAVGSVENLSGDTIELKSGS